MDRMLEEWARSSWQDDEQATAEAYAQYMETTIEASQNTWTTYDHKAYVRGLKDALYAVEHLNEDQQNLSTV